MISMKKPLAIGLFVISVLVGIASVIIGTTTGLETFVWTGMMIIGLGIINLTIKLTFPEPIVPVVIEKPKRAVKRKRKKIVKKTKKKAVRRKK